MWYSYTRNNQTIDIYISTDYPDLCIWYVDNKLISS